MNFSHWKIHSLAILSLYFILSPLHHVAADLLCMKGLIKNGDSKIKISAKQTSASSCPQGFTKLADTEEFKGDKGDAGTDGQLRIYGDGSAGALTVSTTTELSTIGYNTQFTNVSILAGATLSVRTGSVIRCSGTFSNAGNIYVGSAGSINSGFFTSGETSSYSLPGASLTGHAAGIPEFGDDSEIRAGAFGGSGIGLASYVHSILLPGLLGGGEGGGTIAGHGASGGGSFVVLCAGSITNTASGSITSNGDLNFIGGGGGGGGVIVLASGTSISNSGTVEASGGKGGDSTISAGCGGGGGGGIIHLIAPSVTAGALTVNPGPAGGTSTLATANPRSGGGGGGGSGGTGGLGCNVNTDGSNSNLGGAFTGVALTTIVDPTALFF